MNRATMSPRHAAVFAAFAATAGVGLARLPAGLRSGGDASPGGGTSAGFVATLGFLRPAANLPGDARPKFRAGQALARQPWVKAPSSTDARDGLGPLYDARSCLACHDRGGRGPAPDRDGALSTATVVRLSLPGPGPAQPFAPEPTYGDQLQRRTTDVSYALGGDAGRMPAEGRAEVAWTTTMVEYADGRTVSLRRPDLRVTDLGYGALADGVRPSLRHAPPLLGLGLLDLVPASAIAARADPDDRDADGISGRVNRVSDLESKSRVIGRFGWKATQPTLRQQVAAALVADMGITSALFPDESCTEAQAACRAAPSGSNAPGEPEISEPLLDLLVDFTRSLAVPERRRPRHPTILAGQRHFAELGCDQCHTPRMRTGHDERWPHLSDQEIWPYTDLLLHDMGEALADGRPDGEAGGDEWRTPPLWGIGLNRAVRRDTGFLHDGRARTVEEAIVWHGGEASASRAAFVAAPRRTRRALVAFVRSL